VESVIGKIGVGSPRRALRRSTWIPWAAGVAAAGLLALLFGLRGRPSRAPETPLAVEHPAPPAPPAALPREAPRDEVHENIVEQLLTKDPAPVPGPSPTPPEAPRVEPEPKAPAPTAEPVPPSKTPEPSESKPRPAGPAEGARPQPAPEKPAPAPVEEKKTVVIAAVLDRADGLVFLANESGRSAAGAGLRIPAGESLETVGPISRAVLEFQDGTRVALGADTTASKIFDRQVPSGRAPEGKRFTLLQGVLAAQVPKQPATEPLQIMTPNAELRVLGTRFTLTVTPASTRLEVKEGRVRLIRKEDGASVDVGADHYAVVAKGIPLVAKPSAGPKIVIREPFETPRVAPGLAFGGDSSGGLRMSPQSGVLSLRVPAKAPPDLPPDGLPTGTSPTDLAKKAADNLVRSATLGSKSDLPRSMWLETRQVFALSNETPLRIRARLWQSHGDPDRISWILLNRALPAQSLSLERRGATLQLWSEGTQTVLWKKELGCVQEWESLEIWITKDQVVVRRNDLTLFAGQNPIKHKVLQVALGGSAKPELAQDEEARFDDLEIAWVTRQDLDDVTK
jgi:hypothetical protein